MQAYVTGPVFTPPSLAEDPANGKKGTLALPGVWGSENWNTGAFDPETGIYYAVSMTLPTIYALKAPPPKERGEGKLAYGIDDYDTMGDNMSLYGPGVERLPLLKPPYGRITALDLNQGIKLWTVANGDGPRDDPKLKSLKLPPLGTPGRPAPLLTKTLLFLGESSYSVDTAGIPGPAYLFAYDKATGERIWQTVLPAGTTGAPITYEIDGKQVIVVPIGDKNHGTAWIAFALKQ